MKKKKFLPKKANPAKQKTAFRAIGFKKQFFPKNALLAFQIIDFTNPSNNGFGFKGFEVNSG